MLTIGAVKHGLSLFNQVAPYDISAKTISLGGVAFSVDTKNYRAPSNRRPSWQNEMESALNKSYYDEIQEVRKIERYYTVANNLFPIHR